MLPARAVARHSGFLLLAWRHIAIAPTYFLAFVPTRRTFAAGAAMVTITVVVIPVVLAFAVVIVAVVVTTAAFAVLAALAMLLFVAAAGIGRFAFRECRRDRYGEDQTAEDQSVAHRGTSFLDPQIVLSRPVSRQVTSGRAQVGLWKSVVKSTTSKQNDLSCSFRKRYKVR
jgi:hypothetical protein